jgi:hypothetical protein
MALIYCPACKRSRSPRKFNHGKPPCLDCLAAKLPRPREILTPYGGQPRRRKSS